MKLKGNKTQSNGRSVVIFDTEGQSIGGVVDQMTANGWRFNRLQVSYLANDGTTKRKNVPAGRAGEIYNKYGFTKWNFEAVNGAASVTGSMDCSKYAIAITGSRGGGYKLLASMHEAPTRRTAAFDSYDRTPRAETGGVRYEDLARASEQNRRDEIDEYERQQTRVEDRAEDAAVQASGKKSKHTGYIILAIIEILFVAPIIFALFAISDTLKGRKALDYDVKEANGHFKEARNLLIGGAVAAIIFAAILIWKFGAYIPVINTLPIFG